MTDEDAADLARYIEQLRQSGRGMNALRRVLAWLDEDGIGLDVHNQRAIVELIWLAWQYPGSARDTMREVAGGEAVTADQRELTRLRRVVACTADEIERIGQALESTNAIRGRRLIELARNIRP